MNGMKSRHSSKFHKNLRKSNFKLLCDRATHFPVPDNLPEVRVISLFRCTDFRMCNIAQVFNSFRRGWCFVSFHLYPPVTRKRRWRS